MLREHRKTRLCMICEGCGRPLQIGHVCPDGRKLCGRCMESIAAAAEETARAREVLAREGIGGYGGYGEHGQ